MKHYQVSLLIKDASDGSRVIKLNHATEAASAPEAIVQTEAWARQNQSVGLTPDCYIASSRVREFTLQP
jgi:hypothetical protein